MPVSECVESDQIQEKILTLGGCVVDEIGKMLPNAEHHAHLWRRPTIALMSDVFTGITYPSDVDPMFLRYISDDCKKFQLFEIQRCRQSSLIFDLTRDVLTPCIEKDGSFIASPAHLIGLVENNNGTVPDGKGNDPYFPDGCQLLHPTDSRFLDIWSDAFSRFLKAIEGKFAKIVLYKATLTDRSLGEEETRFGSEWAAASNVPLEKMIAYAESFGVVETINVPEQYHFSARDVIWSGPTHTHFVNEAIALAADQAAKILCPGASQDGAIFARTVLETLRKYHRLNEQHLKLADELAELKKQKDALDKERDGHVQRIARIDASRDALVEANEKLLGKYTALQSAQEAFIERRNALEERCEKLADERAAGSVSLTEAQLRVGELTARLTEATKEVRQLRRYRKKFRGRAVRQGQSDHTGSSGEDDPIGSGVPLADVGPLSRRTNW